MNKLSKISDKIHEYFDEITSVRDKALINARQLTRNSAQAIRAVHRNEYELAEEHLQKGQELVNSLHNELQDFPTLYHAGYTQDAIKEFVEATITHSLIKDNELVGPDELQVEYATYLKGLAEVVGELRRRCMDILRKGYSQEAELLLSYMDEIYAILVTMDYPDAITMGLRRQTDLVRGITERTRGDLTLSLREEKLKKAMQDLIVKLPDMEEE